MKTYLSRFCAALLASAAFFVTAANAAYIGDTQQVMSQRTYTGSVYGYVWTTLTAPSGAVYKDPTYPAGSVGTGGNHYTTVTFNEVGTWYLRQYSRQGQGGTDLLSQTSPITVLAKTATVTVNVSPAGAGTAIGGGTYNIGSTATLSASAGGAYNFSGWTGGVTSSSNPYSFTVSGDTTVTANFSPKATATLTANASGGGSVTPATQTVYFGATAKVTATANGGYYFAGWSGAASGTANPLTVTMDVASKTVTANFSPNSYSVSTGTNGTGSGSVSGGGTYSYGSTATLQANPSAGSYFAGWSGALSGTTNPAGLYVDGSKSVTATFNLNTYTLTTNTSGSGSVTAGGTYNYGTNVSITATPSTGYYFSGWSGAATGTTNPVTISMTSSQTLTANFAPYSYTLTTNTSGTGSVTAGGSYSYGSVRTITATPGSGFYFSGWSGAASGTTNPVNITVDSNKTLTANFAPIQYTLSVSSSPAAGGSASGSGTYNSGTVVNMTATPNTGYYFSGWSGAITGTSNPGTITMTSNANAVANFAAFNYTVTTATSPANLGTVTGGGTYAYGSTASVSAPAVTGYTFTGWSGATNSTANPATFTVTGNVTATANYTVNNYTLTTNTAGTGSGSVTAGGTYPYGTVRSITATPNAGMQFAGWSGAATGTTNPINVTVDSSKTLTANFAPITYTVSATVAGSGSVSGTGTYNSGATATLTATPGTGYSFSAWSGGVTSTANPVSFTVSGNTSVTATFTKNNYTVTTATSPAALGTVTGGGTYAYGTATTITAPTVTGYTFTGFSGGLTGTTNPQNLTVSANTTVTANYTVNSYTLTTNTAGTGTGSVTAGGTFTYGTVRTITATPNTGMQFTGWSGAATGTTNPINVSVDSNKTLTANFAPITYTVTTATSPAGIGTVSGGGTFNYNQTTTITAPSIPGYTFTGFSGGITGTTNPQTLTVTANSTVTANYTANQYTVTTATSPAGLGTVSGAGTYSYNQGATITAPTVTGYTFSGFTGALTGSTNPQTLTVTGNATVTANYTANLYNVSVTVTPAGAGSVTGGGTYQYGQSCTLTPSAGSSYYFGGFASTPAGFSGAGATLTVPSPAVTGTVTQNVSVTATFMPKLPQNVTVGVPGIITPSATGFQITWSSAEIPGNAPSSIIATGAATVTPTGYVVVSAVAPTPVLTLTFPGNTFYLPATISVPLNVVSGGATFVVDNTAGSAGAIVSGAANGASAGAATTLSTTAAQTTIQNTRTMLATGTAPTTSAPTTVTATASSSDSTPSYTSNGVTYIWDSTLKRWVVKQ